MISELAGARSIVRYWVIVFVTTVAALLIAWTASRALLLMFAGVLFAAFLDAITRLLGKAVPASRGVRLAIVCTILSAALIAALGWGGTAIATQGGELASTLREQINHMLAWLDQRGIQIAPDGVGALADQGHQPAGAPTLRSVLPDVGGLFGPAWTAIAMLLGVLGEVLIIIFLGVFLAAQPSVYRDAVLLLIPPAQRGRYREVLDESGETLRHWLLGQSLTMSLIGLFVWLGLTLAGVGPPFLLGLQAGLLAFVPTLGPLLAGIAIMLASFASGLWSAVGALIVYLVVQTVESYLLTPIIQKRAIAVPPAFLFASQIVLGLLFGFYGLALATPLAAVARVFILRLYVERAPRLIAADGTARTGQGMA
ncbi:AI-2E family transporter [Bradyrhizobium sp. 83012]|uniref:AI-2E family transporter n=1 Tax=Bradyrhizobium aeschynomenes TaxID=2734909 RepID=A0ABX2C5S3_9BRAD|nr:AI-2E family transporter [Bradyrhizobium aeschynomenes]NPU63626.1 AI-2E family transporter [Bradyrhizobium aeschynomenes]NPV19373.1 AI-2E family transporter [Bradyrhizobium aeschynomenes]